jgi:hypothetical protein
VSCLKAKVHARRVATTYFAEQCTVPVRSLAFAIQIRRRCDRCCPADNKFLPNKKLWNLKLEMVMRMFRPTASALTRLAYPTRKMAPRSCMMSTGPAAAADAPPLRIQHLPVGPFQMNQYIIGCEETKEAALIDCGATGKELEALLSWADGHEFKVTSLLFTHAHIDHVFGLSETRLALPDAPIYLHPEEMIPYMEAKKLAKGFGIDLKDSLPTGNIVPIKEGNEVKVGNLTFKVSV